MLSSVNDNNANIEIKLLKTSKPYHKAYSIFNERAIESFQCQFFNKTKFLVLFDPYPSGPLPLYLFSSGGCICSEKDLSLAVRNSLRMDIYGTSNSMLTTNRPLSSGRVFQLAKK